MKKSEKRAEFERHRDEIQSNYDSKMKALYLLYPEFAQNVGESFDNGIGSHNVANRVREIFHQRPGQQINTKKVLELLSHAHRDLVDTPEKRIAISNTLARLANRHEIERISEKGAKPAIYKLKENTSTKANLEKELGL